MSDFGTVLPKGTYDSNVQCKQNLTIKAGNSNEYYKRRIEIYTNKEFEWCLDEFPNFSEDS